MFSFRDDKGASSKSIETLSEEMKHFNNQRKLVELDLEKRILWLEDVLKDLKRSLGSLDSLEELKEFISNIEYVRVKLRDLEDLSLIDKLEGVEVKEKVTELISDQEEIKQKVDLVVQALKNFDPNEGDMKKTLNSVKDIQARLESLDGSFKELSGICLKATDLTPVVQKIDELDAHKESVKTDLQKIVSTLREELEIHDKRIVSIQQTLSSDLGLTPMKEQLTIHEKELEILREHNRKLLALIESRPKASSERFVDAEKASDVHEKVFQKLAESERMIAGLRQDLNALNESFKKGLQNQSSVRAGEESTPAEAKVSDLQQELNSLKELVGSYSSKYIGGSNAQAHRDDAELGVLKSAIQKIQEQEGKNLSDVQIAQIRTLINEQFSAIVGETKHSLEKIQAVFDRYRITTAQEFESLQMQLSGYARKQEFELLQNKLAEFEKELILSEKREVSINDSAKESFQQLAADATSLRKEIAAVGKDLDSHQKAVEEKLTALERNVAQRLEKLSPEVAGQINDAVTSRFKDTLDDLASIRLSVKQETSSLKNEMEKISQHVDLSESSLLTQTKKIIDERLGEVLEDIAGLRSSIEDDLSVRTSITENSHLDERLEVTHERIDRLGEELRRLQETHISLEQSIRKDSEETERKIRDLQQKTDQINSVQKSFPELMQKKLSEHGQNVDIKIENYIQRTAKDIAAINADVKNHKNETEKNIADILQRIELSAGESEKKREQSETHILEHVTGLINNEMSDVIHNLTEMHTAIKEEREADRNELLQKLQTVDQKIRLLAPMDEVAALKQSVQNIEQRIVASELDIKTETKISLQTLKARLEEFDTSLAKTKASIPSVSKQEVDDLYTRLHEVTSKYTELCDVVQRLNTAIQRGMSDLNKSVFGKVTQDGQALKQEITYLQEQVDELQNNLFVFEQGVRKTVDSSHPVGAESYLQALTEMQKSQEDAIRALQLKHDREIAEIKLLVSQKPREYTADTDVVTRVDSLRKENDILRKELERIKDVLIQMIQNDKSHALVIQ